jgi:hypothetical protein
MLSTPALGPTQPSIQWIPGALSPGVKLPGREADHSSPTSVEVKKTWIFTSTTPYVFMGIVLNWLSTRTTLPYSSQLLITSLWYIENIDSDFKPAVILAYYRFG